MYTQKKSINNLNKIKSGPSYFVTNVKSSIVFNYLWRSYYSFVY